MKETDRKAEERRLEIDKAGDMMLAQSKDIERRLNGIAKRNTVGFGLMGICSAVMFFADRTGISKFEKKHGKGLYCIIMDGGAPWDMTIRSWDSHFSS